MTLLVVDVQEMILTPALYEADVFADHVKQLLAAARESGIEVIYVRHDDGTELTKGADGFEIAPCVAPLPQDKIFDKHVNSAFRDTGLIEYLRAKQESEIMLVGLQTDFCIDATVKCGFEHGFTVFVPAHCNSTVDNDFLTGEQSYRYYNEVMWNKRYATCIGFESALDQLATLRA